VEPNIILVRLALRRRRHCDGTDSQFDPLDHAQQLETAGVPKAQAAVHARTLAHVISDCVAVPADLMAMKRELVHQISETETRLRAELAQTELRLKGQISKAESALRAQIQAVEGRLNSRLSALAEEIAALKTEMKFHRWANGLTIALIAGIYLQLLFP
jgi:ABC-type phosphate transport system auxiliary subunit